MRISTRLRIAALVPMLMALAIGASLALSHESTRKLEQEENIAYQISERLSELNDLARSYVLRHEEQPRQRFLLAHDETTKLIGAAAFVDLEQQRLLESLGESGRVLRSLFLKLVENYERHGGAEDGALREDAEDRLSGQLFMRSREAKAQASRLVGLISDDVVASQHRIFSLTLTSMVVVGASLSLVLLSLMRTIARSIERLQKGTEIIGSGDLTHRIGLSSHDEIGRLSKAFDRMTEQLQQTTVSRDALAAEAEERKRAVLAMKESEDRFRNLAEATFEGIVQTEHGRVVDCNEQYARMTGYEVGELVGMEVSALLASEDRERVMDNVRAGRESILEARLLCKDGSILTVEAHGRSLPYQGRERRFTTIHDVTERKRAEAAIREARDHLEVRVEERTVELADANRALEEEIAERQRAQEGVRAERQRFNDVLETLPAYLVLLTPDYHVAFANRFFRERFGESHGRRCFEYLFGRAEPCEICETYTVLKTMAPHRWEWTGPDGCVYDVHDFPFPDTDGSPLILEMGIDVTDRKRAEEELRRHKDHLEELVRERTSQLESRHAELAGEIAERKRAEEELQKAFHEAEEGKRILDALMEYVPEGITIAEAPDARIRMVSRHGQETLGGPHAGMTAEAVAEQWRVYHPDGVRLMGAEDLPLARAIRTGEMVRDQELVQVNAEGRRLFLLCDAAPIRSRTGEILGAIVAWRDVTARRQTEQALRESEERYHSLFENMTEGFALHEILTDENGKPCDYRFLDVNPSFERLTGLNRDHLLGKRVLEVLPNNDPHWVEVYGKVALIGEPAHFESYSTGLGRWYEVFAYRPAERQFAVIFRDVTARKKAELALQAARAEAENEKRRLEAVMGALPVGVAIIDPKGGNVRSNAAFEAVWGGPRPPTKDVGDYVAYRAWWADTGEPVGPDEWASAQAVREGRTVVGQLMDIQRFDGRRVTVLNSGAPVLDAAGNIIGAAVAIQDITALRQAEQALRESEHRHRALSEALREADRRKDQFFAVLSHELRNPLSPIRNALYILGRTAPGSEQGKRALSIIDRQVGHLSRMVDDLLDVTRITRGKVQLRHERIELADLARRTLEDHHSLFATEGIELQTEIAGPEMWVHGDATRIAQVLGNLLHNSAKFTGRGGRTVVSLGRDEGAGEAVLSVRDSGAGISPEMLPQLFEPFMQADRTLDRSRGGLGLGLALVKGLVELHGGKVDARSAGPGAGAEFTVRLPLAGGTGFEGAAGTLPKRIAPRRILIIEDNVDAAETLRDVLELGDHEVRLAFDGPEGLQQARESKPEVVLCDIGLPGMDGYEVARTFRADEALKDVFLVALSGYALPEDLHRAAQAGFNRHLAKPPSLEKLEELLSSL